MKVLSWVSVYSKKNMWSVNLGTWVLILILSPHSWVSLSNLWNQVIPNDLQGPFQLWHSDALFNTICQEFLEHKTATEGSLELWKNLGFQRPNLYSWYFSVASFITLNITCPNFTFFIYKIRMFLSAQFQVFILENKTFKKG